MGLDMYFYATKNKEITEEKLNNAEVDNVFSEVIEVSYFRKHPNLHGQIEQYYLNKHKVSDDFEFNCVYHNLSKEECEEILEMSKNNLLPYTQGFFFGESTKDDNKETIECMEKLIELINDGYQVFYYSWW